MSKIILVKALDGTTVRYDEAAVKGTAETIIRLAGRNHEGTRAYVESFEDPELRSAIGKAVEEAKR